MNTPVPETAIVPSVDDDIEALVPWEAKRRRVSIFTTMPPDATLNLMVSATRIRDHLGEALNVTDVIVHRAQVNDNDGLPQDARRTVLVCKDGAAYACVSDGVISSLELIVGAYGNPPWPEGLKLIPTAVETRRGFTTLRLVPEMARKVKK